MHQWKWAPGKADLPQKLHTAKSLSQSEFIPATPKIQRAPYHFRKSFSTLQQKESHKWKYNDTICTNKSTWCVFTNAFSSLQKQSHTLARSQSMTLPEFVLCSSRSLVNRAEAYFFFLSSKLGFCLCLCLKAFCQTTKLYPANHFVSKRKFGLHSNRLRRFFFLLVEQF